MTAKEAQSEAPSVDEILHDFAVEESLREVNLSDKLKRKVITADEYDDRLTEGYRKNLEEAAAKINSLIREAKKETLLDIMGKFEEIYYPFKKLSEKELKDAVSLQDIISKELKELL